MNFWIIQGLGFTAFLIGISMYQLNKRRIILSLQATHSLLFGIHYLLLGSLNSMLMCISGAGRNIIFQYDNRFSKKVRYITISKKM